jgi:WD40 repeat protein
MCQLLFANGGGQLIAVGKGRVSVWDTSRWQEVLAFPGPDGDVRGAAVSLDGQYLAAVCATPVPAEAPTLLDTKEEHELKLWDLKTGKVRQAWKGVRNCVAFSLDGRRLATGGDEKTAKIWNAKSGKRSSRAERTSVPLQRKASRTTKSQRTQVPGWCSRPGAWKFQSRSGTMYTDPSSASAIGTCGG